MTIGMRQEAQQSQTVTYQAIQAVQILEYSQDDLEAFVREQLERNPLLRLAGDLTAPQLPSSHIQLRTRPTTTTSKFNTTPDSQELLEALQAESTLQDHLRQQAAYLRISKAGRLHVDCLIDSLEPDGYLRSRLEDLAPLLDTSTHALEQALERVQALGPAGIGARDLKECLWLQLREQNQATPTMKALLEALDLVAAGDLKRVAKRCGIAIHELPALLDRLRRLDPKPGYQFNTDHSLPVQPDVIVTIKDNGGIRVEINPALLPRVTLDHEYFAELSAQTKHPMDVNFLQTCYRDASTLIHNLHQRAQTTLKIATEVIRNQTEYLFEGDGKLRPLSQKDIARLVGVHESTVSRTIANRYLLCPQGQVPLKHFFSEKLSKGDSRHELSATAIRHHIRQLMSLETPKHILSDEDIVDSLRKDGMELARRTVAKYRSQLRIPSSSDRRRRLRLAEATETARPQRL